MADNTWKFLEHQESNPEALKQAVDTLIGYTKKKSNATLSYAESIDAACVQNPDLVHEYEATRR